MARVLVTGGAGYIGSITVRTLLEAGYQVRVLDTLERGWQAAIDPRAEFTQGNVGDRSILSKVLPGCDVVMHLAGYIEVAESQRDPELYRENNVRAPEVLLKAMVEYGVPALVFSSTAAVYGAPRQAPISETALTEPINAYGQSKLAFEQLLDRFATQSGLRSIRFRYFNAAGAWPDGSLGEAHKNETHIIPRIFQSIMRQQAFEVFGNDYETPDGTCIRDYIHVCDLAQAHRIAIERLVSGQAGGVYNLGNGQGYSNLELVQMCSKVSGQPVSVIYQARRSGDPAQLIASADRAKQELGWLPERGDLQTMVQDAWMWHQAHPNGY